MLPLFTLMNNTNNEEKLQPCGCMCPRITQVADFVQIFPHSYVRGVFPTHIMKGNKCSCWRNWRDRPSSLSLKTLHIQKMWMSQAHIQPSSTDDLCNHHSFQVAPKITVTNSVSASEIWSQPLLCSWVMGLNNNQKSVSEEHYDFTMKLMFDLSNIKCHHL